MKKQFILLAALCIVLLSGCNKVPDDYGEIQAENVALKSGNGTLKEENNTLQQEINMLNNEKDTLEKSLQALKEDSEQLKTKLQQTEADFEAYKEQMKPYATLSVAEAEEKTAKAKLEKAEADEAYEAKQKAKAEKEKAEKEAKEKEAKAKEAKGYETGITYNQLARTPDDYKGEKVKFTGKVIQVIEGDNEVQIRLAINSDYDKVVFCVYESDIVKSRVLEDDKITIYGVSAGLISYDSTLGGTITIPAILVDRIDQ